MECFLALRTAYNAIMLGHCDGLEDEFKKIEFALIAIKVHGS